MNSRILGGALAAVVTLAGQWQVPAHAEDIDLFVQPPVSEAGAPNVLFLLDNTGNWGRDVDGESIWTNEVAAIVQTLADLPVNEDGSARFRLGLMMFTETGNPNNNVDGGYIRAAIRAMTEENKQKYIDLFNEFDVGFDRSNSGKSGLAMAEAWKYFNGDPPVAGNSKYKTDFTDNSIVDSNGDPVVASNAIYALPDNALEAFAGSPYNSPIVDGSCGRNYIIYISNGAAQDSASDSRRAAQLLAAAAQAEGIAGATTQIPISPTGSADNMADEWARFMYRSQHEIVSYTVDVDPIRTGQGPGWTAMLKSTAAVSNGKYFEVTSRDQGASIADALGRIFSEIQAVNSVFASVSLPVSVNTQGTYLNQIFVGMFRPDADAMPLWAGNIKQYKLGFVNSQLRTLDADEQSAINAQTGFINECARSYWSTADSYWQFQPDGACLAVPNSAASNAPDGNVVAKGAQGQKLRATAVSNRRMKTCAGNCSSGLQDFGTSNASLTAGLLNAVDATERDQLIGWHRGQDNRWDEDIDNNWTEMRPSAHGDVIHSRPVAINFGSDAQPKVVVFYGANDGSLRAVNGNRSAAVPGPGGVTVPAGGELWSFVPPEFFEHIKRLRENIVPINFTGALNPETREPKPYGIDGPINAYVDGNSVWIQAGMRRGGRAVYAFNVSAIAGTANPAVTAASPSLMWKVGCDDTGCDSGFEDIGQTWSAPRVLKTTGYTDSGEPVPMLAMGGGYDVCEDSDPHSCDADGYDAKGNHVYLLDARDGSLLNAFETDRPVAADVFVVPDANTGLAKYLYVTDTGGNVYRISAVDGYPFGSTDPQTEWEMVKIASLGCDTTSPCTANRKFLYSPDVVEKEGIVYVLVGSGDREKPIRQFASAYNTENFFFMIKDVPQDPDWFASETADCGSAIVCRDSLVFIDNAADPPEVSPEPEDIASAKGWYLGLNDHEQVVTAPITVFGVTTFSTHTPTPPIIGACAANLGTARVYNVRFRNAGVVAPNTARDGMIEGGGLPPSPVAGQVTLDNGVTVPFIIGADPSSPLEASLPVPPASAEQPKAITYWYIEK